MKACIGTSLAKAAALTALALATPQVVSPLAAQPAYLGGGSSAVTSADSARDAELDQRTAEIASRFRCLVCRGQSVQESSSQLAREMQALIRQKLEEGETEEEIEAFFVASYGDFILLKPRAEGISLLVYVLPLAGFLLAFIAVAVKMRGARAATVDGAPFAAGTAPLPSDLSDDDRAWIDAAIREEL